MNAATAAQGAQPQPGPCLITGPLAGPIIGAVFVAAVLLFLFGLLTLAP